MQTPPKPSSKSFLALAPLAALGLAAAPAHAGTITLNFDALSAASAKGPHRVGTTYSVRGFTLTSGDPIGFEVENSSSVYGDGETSLYSVNYASTTLTQDNGKAFNFSAIDLGPFAGNFNGTQFTGPVTFTGTRADGTTVTATKITTSSRFQTFTFTGFTGLKSLTFKGRSHKYPTQFDNVVLTPAPVSTEP